MLDKLETLLNMQGENEIVEFKEAKQNYDFHKLGKYFSAISNEANLKGLPQGWLVFGVKDDQTVVGSSFRKQSKDLLSLKKEVADRTTNRLTFIEIHEIKHEDGELYFLKYLLRLKGYQLHGMVIFMAVMGKPLAL
jgi:ATP-dependent DNA helicase RecG